MTCSASGRVDPRPFPFELAARRLAHAFRAGPDTAVTTLSMIAAFSLPLSSSPRPPADALEGITGEAPERLAQVDLAGAGESVDEYLPLPTILDRETKMVDQTK
jgi:hypothetical protein